jgi:hypothetical protein
MLAASVGVGSTVGRMRTISSVRLPVRDRDENKLPRMGTLERPGTPDLDLDVLELM